MANHKSALKRHKQSEIKRLRNNSYRSSIKTSIRSVREAAAAGDGERAQAVLKSATSLLDKAVIKGVLHRNNASRRIARLTTAVNAVK